MKVAFLFISMNFGILWKFECHECKKLLKQFHFHVIFRWSNILHFGGMVYMVMQRIILSKRTLELNKHLISPIFTAMIFFVLRIQALASPLNSFYPYLYHAFGVIGNKEIERIFIKAHHQVSYRNLCF